MNQLIKKLKGIKESLLSDKPKTHPNPNEEESFIASNPGKDCFFFDIVEALDLDLIDDVYQK